MATDAMFWDDGSAECQGSWALLTDIKLISNSHKYPQGAAMKSEFRKHQDKLSARTAIALKEEARKARFTYGMQNAVRLKKALASVGLHHLQDSTLLSPEIHKLHAKQLADRYLKKLATVQRLVRRQQRDLIQVNKRYGVKVDPRSLAAQDRFRFPTVLHSMEVLDVDRTLRTVRAFKEQLQSVIERCRGLWCLGVIEVEVVSMDLMRQLTDQSDSEERKLAVCESMVKRLPKRHQGLSVFFLIHFHGIVVATQPRHFTDLEQQLRRQWKHEPRQVLMKPLSKVFNGKAKTPEKSVVDIARYITKGGNDWIKKKAYLRYKLSFDQEHLESEDAWVNKNWRRNQTLRGERIEEGLEDTLAMSRSEIAALASVIDGMMGTTRSRTGYLVFARSKRRKLSTTGSA
ncbi:MAG: hypothetical protein A4E20_03995 [Nitrospira sp. SG-bin2]|jgi:hypothetical protein|nr:MAG: hypothetical protein A4E20_03995 [Nitrospira sp. SG-bin2]